MKVLFIAIFLFGYATIAYTGQVHVTDDNWECIPLVGEYRCTKYKILSDLVCDTNCQVMLMTNCCHLEKLFSVAVESKKVKTAEEAYTVEHGGKLSVLEHNSDNENH